MSDASLEPDTGKPERVHWSPKQGPVFGLSAGSGGALAALAVGAAAFGAFAVGAVAIGALAIGKLAVGKLAIGRADLKDVRIGRLIVDDLVVVHRSKSAD